MAKYIDKAAVVAEIKRYKHKADERLKIKGRTLAEDLKDLALQNLCGNLIHFIDTLEVKEVDEEYNGKAMLHILTKGVEQGKREILDKACEWLKKNRKNYSLNALGEEYLIDDFKKAMKGE